MLDRILKYTFIITLTSCVLLLPDVSAPAIRGGITLCITRVIPAIFPFLVLSSMISRSNVGYMLEKVFEPVTVRLFRLPKCAATAFFSGLLCGFPIGAQITGDLYSDGRLTKSEAERLLMFCNNTGPSFIIGAVGIDILSSVRLGLALYLFQALSSLICGVITARFAKPEQITAPPSAARPKSPRFSELLHGAVISAVKSCTVICGFVIFFSFIVTLIELPLMSNTGNSLAVSVLDGVFELTRGIYSLEGAGIRAAFIISGGLICWSGFSVHFQTAALLAGTELSMHRYYLGKLICTLICLSFCTVFAFFVL